MKRWAIVTVGLYALLLLSLTVPGIYLASISFAGATAWTFTLPFSEAWAVFREWGYWVWLAILVAAQALLLLVPVRQAERRLRARRTLAVPVVTASFLLANLLLAGVFAVLAALFGDKASVAVEGPAAVAEQLVKQVSALAKGLQAIGIGPVDYVTFFCLTTVLGYLIGLWLAWGLVFFHFAQADQPDSLIRRTTRWLLRGSIAELLVAVPCHIIVRHRNDCCAPAASFWGIVTGLSVLLLAFGPGVYFLFAHRLRQTRAKQRREMDPT